MRTSLGQILQRLHRDESGQSLIVIISAMTVLLGMAGFGIDTATWMVKHHNAQVVADSAALAAAQCLADPNQASTMFVSGEQVDVPKCTSSTDTTDAQQVAVDYAAANGLTISTSNVSVDTTTDVVTVTATTSSPALFARLFGMMTTTESAHAGAGWKTGNQCATDGPNCDFMFANSSNCSSGSYALNISPQGASTINGNIQTNGNLEASETGNAGGINGTGNYGPGSGCTSTTGGNHDAWKTGAPTQDPTLLSWPIDYSKDFPACVPGSTCSTNPLTYGYPTWCTNTGSNIVLNPDIPADAPQPGQIYCASGPAPAKPSDPSTWTGSITITSPGSQTWTDTFVAGTISYSGAGGDTISACGWSATGFSSSSCSAPAPADNTTNYPIFYAVGTDPNPTECAAGNDLSSSCAFYMHSNGNLTLDGDMFIENGMASFDFHGAQSAADTFIEANTIAGSLDGNFQGDGPPTNGSGGTGSGGSVTLVQ